MQVVAMANLRWAMICPHHFRLMRGPGQEHVDLIFNGDHWYLEGHGYCIAVPDRDTGAMILAKEMHRQAQQ